MKYSEQYHYPFKDLCEKGKQTIYTKDLNKDNINRYFESCINIFKDGIETKEVQDMMLTVIFEDNIDVDLSIFDFTVNLMFWCLNTNIDKPIYSVHLVFFEDITKRRIKEYIDNMFIDKYRKYIPFIRINQICDDVIGKFRALKPFQLYLANTLNIEDTLDLMKKYPEFNDTVHFNTDGIPLEDIKDKGMEAANTQIRYIENSDHCLRDSFRTGEAISPKQYKEVAVNIGTKPDGTGSVFPHPIKHSFMNGGLQDPEELCVESSVGRIAQILQKNNVGESGAFARNLELNNQNTFLHEDPDYVCDTKNFEKITITDATKLNMFNFRYYRENPKGVDKLLIAKRDKHLIGKTLFFRSPMTCASAARGRGICYKCYGDLAYTNQEVNIGQIAAEALSSIYTQILLSAKHLLESLIVKINWTEKFYEYFAVEYNTIGLKENFVYRGCKLIIDEEIQSEEDIDETPYSYYVNSFKIRDAAGNEYSIYTSEADNIYLTTDLYDFIYNPKNKAIEFKEDNVIEIDMVALMDLPALFIMEIKNNELSRTMDQINKLIDSKKVIEKYDRNTILEEFINTNISGGIKLNSVHFEILIMNQMRDIEDELMMPDWSIPNQEYQILTLSKSLSENRSITIRLQSDRMKKALNNPRNRFITHPAMSDLFYMEQPQEFLEDKTGEIISDDYRPESDIEEAIIEPVSFENTKVRVGRKVKKRKVAKKNASNREHY